MKKKSVENCRKSNRFASLVFPENPEFGRRKRKDFWGFAQESIVLLFQTQDSQEKLRTEIDCFSDSS